MYWHDCLYEKKNFLDSMRWQHFTAHEIKFNWFKPQSMFIVWIFILPLAIVFCYSRVLNKNSSDFNRHCLNNTVASKNLNKKSLLHITSNCLFPFWWQNIIFSAMSQECLCLAFFLNVFPVSGLNYKPFWQTDKWL